jgi:hypothetical protein
LTLECTPELALYVLPRAIDSLAMILRDRKIFSGFRHGEVALFSASMAVMMYSYEVSLLEESFADSSSKGLTASCVLP